MLKSANESWEMYRAIKLSIVSKPVTWRGIEINGGSFHQNPEKLGDSKRIQIGRLAQPRMEETHQTDSTNRET